MCFFDLFKSVCKINTNNKFHLHDATTKFNFFNNYILGTTSLEIKFMNAQKVYHTLTKYIRIKKWKDMDITTDLTFNSLEDYSDKLLIDIYHENFKYKFHIHDLQKIWRNSLTTNEIMVCQPSIPKNPYNNIFFTKSNLYNIYFKLFFNNLRINKYIESLFQNNMHILNYHTSNYVNLYEHSLKVYLEENILRLVSYSNLIQFKQSYPELTKKLYFKHEYPLTIKYHTIKYCKKCLIQYYLYIISLDSSLLNHKMEYYKHLFLKELKLLNKYIVCRPYLKVNNKRKINTLYYFQKNNLLVNH